MTVFDKKKEYIITEAGQDVFMNEVERLQELVENARIMGAI